MVNPSETNPQEPQVVCPEPGRLEGEALHEQAERISRLSFLNTVMDSILEFAAILNEHRQIVFANQQFREASERITGTCDLIGRRPGEALSCMHSRANEAGCGHSEFCVLCGAMQAILESQKGVTDMQECRIKQPSGDALDLRVWAHPFMVNGEKFTFFAATDVSHEKRRRALERIFFHDLRNTASGLLGFAELIKTDADQLNNMERYKDVIHSLAQRLMEEINSQAELSAAESGELRVRPVQVTPHDVIHITLNTCQSLDEAKDKELEAADGVPQLLFHTDLTLLRRVLGNLVKNALEASRKGQKVAIGAEVTEDEKQVMFWVHNESFMAYEVQAQMFQRSFSTKGLGRGLGTYSVRLLTEKYLNGKVYFTSTEAGGTRFSIELPLERDKQPAASASDTIK